MSDYFTNSVAGRNKKNFLFRISNCEIKSKELGVRRQEIENFELGKSIEKEGAGRQKKPEVRIAAFALSPEPCCGKLAQDKWSLVGNSSRLDTIL